VHNLDQASEALELPVDYLGVGSVYSSETEKREVIGIDRFEKICRTVSLPVAAIGGITVDRVEAVIKAGASGVAAISGIWDVEDVEGRVREYVSRLEAIKRSR
jgi:thiazole tautomerase (transcriptional regulator TenI)